MKKIFLAVMFSFLIIFPQSVNAEIRQTENGTVIAKESAFTYSQPASVSEKKPVDVSNSKKQAAKENIFSIYVKSTRFYNRNKINFRAHQELDVMSNSKTIDLLLDSKLPPRIEYTKAGLVKKLMLKKISYNDQYFISFKIKPVELIPLYDADKVEIVFPVITNGTNISYQKDKNGEWKQVYVKKELEKSSQISEVRYVIPRQIVGEWQDVLNADLRPGSISAERMS
ncbi:hypothetical protein [Pectinatus frisingensis]|uniref:hypothetical protein n=1 Tax=Pectinatus frisingensis TaxID=865 RepID=UPI0018C5EEA8|nr:hypothetical protein [Pectinatus frisingensis]